MCWNTFNSPNFSAFPNYDGWWRQLNVEWVSENITYSSAGLNPVEDPKFVLPAPAYIT